LENLKQKGLKALGWDFTGRIATQGVGFVITIFLARLLEPKDFGLVAMVMVIIGMAQVFTDVGLSSALIQRRRALPIHYSSAFYFNVAAGTALTLITYFSAGWIGRFYSNETLVPLAQVLSLLFLINSFSSVQTARLRKQLENRLIVRCSVGASITSGVVGVVLAFKGAGVWALVAQSLVSGLVYNLLVWLASRWVPGLQFSIKALKQLWAFGFRMFLSGLLDAIFTRLDYLLIGKLFTPQLLGFFQRAKSLNLVVVNFTSASLMSVLFPYLSAIQQDLPRFQSTVMRSLEVICFAVFFLLGGLYVVSAELILLLFGEKWTPSIEFFEILVISGFAYPISALLVNILKSRGKSKEFLRLEVLKKSLLACNLVVLFFLGIKFYLYGLIVTSVLAVSLNAYFAARETGLRVIRFAKPMFVQGGLAIFAVYVTKIASELIQNRSNLELFFAQGVLFVFMYCLLSGLFKTRSMVATVEQVLPLITNRAR
jgi:O-antigen/teichoic acid export membrane protein